MSYKLKDFPACVIKSEGPEGEFGAVRLMEFIAYKKE